jgi:hypothetical protein
MTIRLDVVQFDGWLEVTSPNVPGLYVVGRDRDAVMKDVLPAIDLLIELDGPDAVEPLRTEPS